MAAPWLPRGCPVHPKRASCHSCAVCKQVDALFGELRDVVKQMLAEVAEEHRDASKRPDLGAAVRRFALTLHMHLDSALESARPLVLAGMKLLPDMARQFAGLVQGLLLQAIHWLSSILEATIGSPVEAVSLGAPRLPPAAVLVYACGARVFEQAHLRECLDGFVRALPSREEVAPLGVDYGV